MFVHVKIASLISHSGYKCSDQDLSVYSSNKEVQRKQKQSRRQKSWGVMHHMEEKVSGQQEIVADFLHLFPPHRHLPLPIQAAFREMSL